MATITPSSETVSELTGLHLYHFSQSNCSMRVRMTLEEKRVPWTSHHVNLHSAENVTPEYFGIHPKGLVPALVHDGVIHIESTDIIDYLDETFADPPLRPANEADRHRMREWMRVAADNHIHVKTYMFAHRIGRRMAKTAPELALYRRLQHNPELLEFHAENSSPEGLAETRVAGATTVLKNCFARLDDGLREHAWIVGDAFSLADITWMPLYVTLNGARFPFDAYPNVLRWASAVRRRASFRTAVSDWVEKV